MHKIILAYCIVGIIVYIWYSTLSQILDLKEKSTLNGCGSALLASINN